MVYPRREKKKKVTFQNLKKKRNNLPAWTFEKIVSSYVNSRAQQMIIFLKYALDAFLLSV